MAASGTLAQQYVEFAAKGLEQLKAQMDNVRAGLQKISDSGEKMQNTISRAANILTAQFVLGNEALNGWIKAGIQGTGVGNILNFQFQQLSRQIAGVFLPTIQKLIDRLREMTQWFRQLTGAQQEQIRHWVEAAAAAMLIVAIAPKVVAALQAIWAAATGGWGALLELIAPLVTMLATVVLASDQGRSALGSLFSGLKAQIGVVFGFIMKLVDALEPAIGPVLDIVGDLLDLVGAFMPLFADLIEFQARLIAPLLQLVSAILKPIIGIIATVLKLLEPFLKLGMAIVNLVVKVLAGSLGVLIGELGKLIENLEGPLIEALSDVLNWVTKAVEAINELADAFGFAGDKQDALNAKRHDVGGGAAGQESLSATWARLQTSFLQTASAVEDKAAKQRQEMIDELKKANDLQKAKDEFANSKAGRLMHFRD